jgi:alpha-amylase
MINDYGFDGVRYADVPNVPKWFWGEFTEAAQTYTLGIVGVDQGTEDKVKYIADYQDYMDGVGDYPLFYNLRSALCNQDMRNLDSYIQNYETLYKAPQYNGIWLGNHDKPRFLHYCQSSYKRKALRNGIIFILFYEGIPMFYYGDEQYFNGGEDPNNREILFGNYNKQSDIYKMIKIANNIRKLFKIYDYDFVKRYADQHYYAFTRGKVLIVISDGTPDENIIEITKHGFNENDKLCNELDRSDCVNIANHKIKIIMKGEPKIYIQYTNNNSSSILYLSMWLFALVLLYI